MEKTARFIVFIGYDQTGLIIDYIKTTMKFEDSTRVKTIGIISSEYSELLVDESGFPVDEQVDYVICDTNTSIHTINILLRKTISVLGIVNLSVIDNEFISLDTESSININNKKDRLFIKLSDDYYIVDSHSSNYSKLLRRAAFLRGIEYIGNQRDTDNLSSDEHIMVCLSNSSNSSILIRKGLELAQVFSAKLTILFVGYEEDISESLKSDFDLAEDYNANVVVLNGFDVAMQISEYTRISKITKLIIGRTAKTLRSFFGNKVEKLLLEKNPNIDIYVIPEKKSGKVKHHKSFKINYENKDLVMTVFTLIVITVLGVIFDSIGVQDVNIILVYLLGVLFISVFTNSYIWSVLSSIISVIIFNYLFMNPRFALSISEQGYPFTLMMMLIAALSASALSRKIIHSDIQLAERAYRTEILLETSLNLQNVLTEDEALKHIGTQLHKLTENEVIILTDINKLDNFLVFPSTIDPDSYRDNIIVDEQIIKQVFISQKKSISFLKYPINTKYGYYAVLSNDSTYAVIGLSNINRLSSVTKGLAMSIISELGFAIESIKLTREKIEREMKTQKDSLRLNILKTISHDLRTPLTGIDGNIQMLMTEKISLEKQEEIYKDIKYDTDWLSRLVENLLAMTRLENNDLKQSMEKNILSEIIEEAIQRVNKKNKTVLISFKDGVNTIIVDVNAQLMIQVFVNLLDNAIKYNIKQNPINVVIVEDEKTVKIKVMDHGIGINDKDKNNIFDMFYTINNHSFDEKRGIGLGLYLSKAIIEAHGGLISVSDNIDGGTVFTIELEKIIYEYEDIDSIN